MPIRWSRTYGDRLENVHPVKGLYRSEPLYLLPNEVVTKAINFEYIEGNNQIINIPAPDLDSGIEFPADVVSFIRYRNRIIAACADGYLYAKDLYYDTPVEQIGQIAGSYKPQFVVFANKLIIASGKLQVYDGSTLSTIEEAPNVRLIAKNVYDNRLIAAGDLNYPSRVWFSGVGSYEIWDPNYEANPALYEDVRWQDGAEIKAIGMIYNDVVVFKGENPPSITRLKPISSTAYQHYLLSDSFSSTLDNVVVTGNEVFFVDKNGLHKLSTTVKYGDYKTDKEISATVRGYFVNHEFTQLFLNKKKAQLWIIGNIIVVYHLLSRRFTIFDFSSIPLKISYAYYDDVDDNVYIAVDEKVVNYSKHYKYILPAVLRTKEFAGIDPNYYELYKYFAFDVETSTNVSGKVKIFYMQELEDVTGRYTPITGKMHPITNPSTPVVRYGGVSNWGHFERDFTFYTPYFPITTKVFKITEPRRLIVSKVKENLRFRQQVRTKKLAIEAEINSGCLAFNKIALHKTELGVV